MKLTVNGYDSRRLGDWAARRCVKMPVYQRNWNRVETRVTGEMGAPLFSHVLARVGFDRFHQLRFTMLPGDLRA